MGDTVVRRNYRVGTRKSELALIQTNEVIQKLEEIYPNKNEFSLTTMDTIGDKILDVPLPKIGEKSLFTQELEKALQDGVVDFVVHSLKDLPTTLPKGKVIGAVLKREDPCDCVILHEKHEGLTLKTLPKGSVIGTSSLRRTAQINNKYSQVKIESIRGNMNTRLKKLNEGLFDGIVVAAAGINRMKWKDKINEILHREDVLYAVGQGALAVECQENNNDVLSLLSPLTDRQTVLMVTAERSFLRKLEGGCSAPVAVNCVLEKNVFVITGLVSSLDGSQTIKETVECTLTTLTDEADEESTGNGSGEPLEKRKRIHPASYCGIVVNCDISPIHMAAAETLGENLAALMISKGALSIMENARKQVTSNSS